jgi:hypothetical protein
MSNVRIRQRAILGLICITTGIESGRSRWRNEDPRIPEIRVHWADDSTSTHTLRDNCLEYHAIFCKYEERSFKDHLLPECPITYRRDPSKTVYPQELSRLAEKVLEEIQTGKNSYDDFVVLKRSDFNPRKASGLIILKYKNYPFILKLFLKTPETFVRLSEGVVPKFLFRMGGGINRHLSGFTRIPNLEKIKELLDESPYWRSLVDTPRKWYWIPKKSRSITIEGKNIGNRTFCETTIPSIYGIVVDAIEVERQFCLSNANDTKFGLAFANYIGNRMDAHVDNLMVEKGTGKVVIIDTEHFPTMVGLKRPINFNSYRSWYLQLSGKCFQDNFMRHKKIRHELQSKPQPEIFTLYTDPNVETHAQDTSSADQ